MRRSNPANVCLSAISYKAAYGHEVARSIIVGEAGNHFDPDVVEAFIQTEQAFVSLLNKLSEAISAAA